MVNLRVVASGLLGGGLPSARWLLLAATFMAEPATLAESPGFEIERVERYATLKPGSTVTVENEFGDVRARFGGYEGKVELRAALQQFDAEGPRLEVEVVERADGLRVRVGDRPEGGGDLRPARRPGGKQRADLVIFVPTKMRLAVETAAGEIEIRGLQADVRARSTSGNMTVRSIKGNLDLASESGSIMAHLESMDLRTTQLFASASGEITLRLGALGHFAGTASTRGLLSTDFSLRVEEDPVEEGRKSATVILGKGTTPIAISSGSGHIRLVRRPSATEAKTQ